MTKTRIAAFGESSVSHSSVHDISSVCLEPIEEEFDFDQCDLSGIISPVSSANFGTLRSNPRFARSLAGFLVSSLPANNLSTRRKNCFKHTDLEKSSLFMRTDIAKENIVERNQGTVSFDKSERELEGLVRKPVNRETRILFDDELDVEKIHSSNGKMSGGKEVSSTDDCDYSQEPDQLSQCNALKVVDTFISLNDLGLSQDEFLTNENLDEIKNPPSSGLKGARCLTRTFSRSPIGRCDIFDSSHEDESGGDFFARKKDFMFPDKKCSIKPSRTLHKSEMKKEPFENGKDKTKFRALCKINFSSLSDLRVKVPNKLQNSKSNKKINIHKESEPEINGNCSNQSIATKKESLQCASQQKIVSSIGGTRNSKKLLLSTTKLSNGTVMSSYVRNGEVSKAMVEPVDEISKGKDHLGVINSLNECKSSSNSREKIVNGGESLDKDKDCLDVGIRSTPIARHTRQSRAEKSSNKTDVLLINDTCKMKYQWNGHSTQDRESSFEKFPNSNKQHGTQIDGGSNLAKCRTRSSVRVFTSCQPKCKRTCLREKMITGEKPLDKDEEYLSADIRSTPVAWRTRKLGAERAEKIVNGAESLDKDKDCLDVGIRSTPIARHTRQSRAEKSSNKTDVLLINDTCKMKYQWNGHSTQDRESSFEKNPNSNKQHGTQIDGGSNLAKCRTRSSVATSTSALKKTQRNEDVITVRAFFSCHLNYDVTVKQEKILSRFEIPVASSISEATHFIADKFSRTRNMLESMAVGRPVVTHLWLESCEQAGFYVDEEKYILRDLEKEKEIGFIMPDSLACARERKLLQDKKVFITENVKPDRKTISNLVMASGGKPIERFHRSMANDKNEILVISCEEDCAMCIPLLEKGLEVFTSELVLNGIVIQKLEYERHRITTRLINLIGNLFLPEAKSK